ncbi:MAG: ATP-binding protein [Deltaproteobacteria bacterium]|nr:ATP-binding protein [Deltaproteobacteria bacterium]
MANIGNPMRTVASTLDAVAHCTGFAAAQARAMGFSPARTREVELAVEEVVANICRYGFVDALGEVELGCRRIDNDKLEFEFIDQGQPFDMLAAPDPMLTSDLEKRDLGGLGIRMLRALVDDATYRREDGRNVLRLIVHAPCRLGPDHSKT